MANGFNITISAVDNASATLTRINKNLSAMQAPAKAFHAQVDKFKDLTGLSKTADNFSKVRHAGLGVFEIVSNLIPAFGVLGSVASAAGVFKMASSFGDMGFQLKQTAQRINISTDSLQKLEGAARLTGASTEDMDAGLKGLQQTLYDAVGGRNVKAVSVFNTIGVAIADSSGHARKADDVFKDLADRIKSYSDPAVKAAVGTVAMGGAFEALLPLLNKGRSGVEALGDAAQDYSGLNKKQIDDAVKLHDAQNRASEATKGLGDAISSGLAPAFTPLLDSYSEWEKANHKIIHDDVEYYARGIGRQLHDTAVDADEAAKAIGGWWHVTESLFALWTGAKFGRALAAAKALRLATAGAEATSAVVGGAEVAGGAEAAGAGAGGTGLLAAALVAAVPVALPALGAGAAAALLAPALAAAVGYDPRRDRSRANMRAGTRGADPGPRHTYGPAGVSAQDTVSAFTAMGYGKADASAIAAQVQAESGGNPFSPGDYVNGKPTAYGLIQAHPDRQANYAKLYGHTMQSVTDRSQAVREQYGFVDWELHNSEKHAFGKLEEAQGPYAKGAALSRYYERAGAVDQAAADRGNLAASIYAQGAPVGLASATPAAAPGAPGATGKVDVNVKLSGSGIQSVTASGSGNVNQPKIASTGVGAGNGGV